MWICLFQQKFQHYWDAKSKFLDHVRSSKQNLLESSSKLNFVRISLQKLERMHATSLQICEYKYHYCLQVDMNKTAYRGKKSPNGAAKQMHAMEGMEYDLSAGKMD